MSGGCGKTDQVQGCPAADYDDVGMPTHRMLVQVEIRSTRDQSFWLTPLMKTGEVTRLSFLPSSKITFDAFGQIGFPSKRPSSR